MASTRNRSLGRALIWPLRRLLDPRFADVTRRMTDLHQSVHDEGTATRVAVGSLTENVKTVVGAYAETHVESMTHLGVELRRLQDEVTTLSSQAYVERLDAVAAGRLEDLDGAAANLINYATSHAGFAGQADLWINTPVVIAHAERDVRWTATNERIVEAPFAFGTVASLERSARILDVGAAESTISLSLASLGHDVTALDPRGYPFAHPNLTVAATTLEKLDEPDEPFDSILLISTLEHVGLGFYGEGAGAEDADLRALERLARFLAPDGLLVLTVPYGEATVAEKERTYDAKTLDRLLQGWTVTHRQIVERRDERTWVPVAASSGPAVAMVAATKA
jgi:2-polyprenyl-3-methyl-5-hydroxy-6-metoxy-1,4-benzoquinol methylase